VKRTENEDAEEVIFTIQGIIHAKELPPIMLKPRYVRERREKETDKGNNKNRISAYRYKFLRQGITLTGLGSPTFMRAVDAIKSIHRRFDRQFEEGALEAWAEYRPDEPETDRIGLWNRYLTPAREAEGMQSVPFLPGVDPNGTLRGMSQEDGMSYVHTEDNQVHYYATRRNEDGHLMYVPPNNTDETTIRK
jgi:hypothetical protein